MIELNLAEIIYQMIGFAVIYYLLNNLLFKPTLEVLDERGKKTTGAIDEAEKLNEEAVEGNITFENRIKEATVKAQEKRSQIRQEGIMEEKKLIEEARAEASIKLQSMREDIKTAEENAIKDLKTEATELSKIIKSKIINASLAIFMLLMPAILLSPAAAHASEGGAGGAGMGVRTFNFILLVILFSYIWKKYISPALVTRAADIKQAIDEAEKAKKEAQAKVTEYKEKLDILDVKVQELTDKLISEGKSEKERIIADAKETVEMIKKQVEITASQEIKKAKLQLKEEAANLAIEIATEVIKKEITKEDQTRLEKEYIENLRLN